MLIYVICAFYVFRTWEEFDCSNWAKDYLKTCFLDLQIPAFADGVCKITACEKAEGSAAIIYTRGKRKPQFDFDISLKWEGELKGEKAIGFITMDGLDYSNVEDFDVEVTCEGGGAEATALKKHVRKALDALREKMQKFPKELLKQDGK